MKLYNKSIYLLLVVLSLIGFVSCKDDANNIGEGRLVLGMNVSMPQMAGADQSKQEEASALLADSCRVRIYNSKGLIRFYKGLNNVPNELQLATGDYRIQAITGDSVPATFKMGYYKGECNFTIEANTTTNVDVTCKTISTLVTISYSDKLKEILTDCNVTVSSPKGSLVYTQEHIDSIGYFILPEGCEELNWRIEGIQTNGNTYTQTGVLKNVKPAMKYNLTFNYNEAEYNQGGAYFNLLVDESTVEKLNNIVIYKRPDIVGVDFDITRPVIFEENSGEQIGISISASSALAQVVVSSEEFTTFGMPTNSIDFVSASQILLNTWNIAGLSYKYEYDSENDMSVANLTFSKSFVKKLPSGSHYITIRVADMHGKEWTQELHISISNAVVVTESVIRSEIWTNRATLRGSIIRETTDPISFQYRIKGTNSWNSVDAERNGEKLMATVYDLTPGKIYEYRAVSGTTPSAITLEFTTESVFVIPNASFENWHQSNSVWLVYGQGEEMWWDTGNHGSATLNKNITTRDTELKHSGNSSIKMQSQFVGIGSIGKFAAGNVFTGKYVGTDGTDGILDFGRPFTSRPSQLKGYYRYVTGEVDYSSTNALPKGSPNDIGNIYIAIGDWSGPIRIATKDKVFFDKNDEHVIGFGEIVQTTNTDGNGLVPFTINIDYRSTDRVPTYIIIVASASMYGDYFTGSSKSTMWLDDLELVYE